MKGDLNHSFLSSFFFFFCCCVYETTKNLRAYFLQIIFCFVNKYDSNLKQKLKHFLVGQVYLSSSPDFKKNE